MKSTLISAALLLVVSTSFLRAQDWPVAIEDNSFLIEEATNQGPRVVQHITTLFRPDLDDNDLGITFTQEWPLGSQRHQLSYTLPYFRGDGSGLGDIVLNYRYQLPIRREHLAVAPRLSLILPTGDEDEGLGEGSAGLEVNLPLSWRLAPQWAFHANVGASHFPSVEGARLGDEQDLTSPFAGISVIWLARSNLNFLVEAIVRRSEEIAASGGTTRTTERIFSPGLRFAIDRGDLQIVPGLAFPVTSAGGRENVGVFLYFSLEHPY
ncbi:MAG TPA: transporter [Thermoanaerobaculia bacterium]|nr:transporter [Thermoanaerobaculia bacterium]